MQILAFVSDRDKGLLDSTSEVFPSYNSIFCLKHLLANIRSHFRTKEYESAVYRLASFRSEEDFLTLVSGFEEMRFKDYILNIQRDSRVLYAKRKPLFGQRTSNIAGSLNSVFSVVRDLPILSICLEIHNYTMNVFFQKRMSNVNKSRWTNFVVKTIRENATLGRRMEVRPSTETQGFVKNFDSEFIVDVENFHCSCLQFQDLRIPCSHAVAFLLYFNKEPTDYSDPIYNWETYKIFYSNVIKPISRDAIIMLGSNGLLPPSVSRPRGRPRKRRIPGNGDDLLSSLQCSRCSQRGHNRRTCTEPVE